MEEYLNPNLFDTDTFITIERIRENIVTIFCNNNKDKYLLAYFYEGGTKNTFSAFEIGYIADDSVILKQQMHYTQGVDFSTEANIHLGLTFEEVVQIKGNPHTIEVEKGFTKISYYMDDSEKSEFLNRYKMPSYFYKLWFKNNQLVKFQFGFDYP